MGLFDFFKRKKDVQTVNNESSYIDHFNLMESRRKSFFQLDERSNLIGIATIISNNDPIIVKDFTTLVSDPKSYYQANQEWCDNYSGDFEQGEDILIHTAYYLAGYENDFTYGAYIDWKEATEDIIWQLNKALEKLKFPIELKDIEFTGEEYTYEALTKINELMQNNGYTLATLDTYSDSYHLYVIPTDKFTELVNLGESIGLDFSATYTE